jgi:hypothetical protein
MSNQNGKPDGGKCNEFATRPQTWRSADRIVTFQDTPAMQIYIERSLKNGSVNTEYFIKMGKR